MNSQKVIKPTNNFGKAKTLRGYLKNTAVNDNNTKSYLIKKTLWACMYL